MNYTKKVCLLLAVFILGLSLVAICACKDETQPQDCVHSMQQHNATEPTCTANGNSEYWQCTKCNKLFTNQNGEKELTADSVVVPTVEHTEVAVSAVAPTCTETGLTVGKKCSVCGTILVAQQQVAAKGHSFSDGVCTVCGTKENILVASEGLEYILSDDGTLCAVVGIGTCTDTDIVIPATHENLPVIGISARAFYDCTGLTSITIPDSIIAIGLAAFYNCTSLTSINIPDSVTYIYDAAFQGCTSLTSVTISNSVTSIGDCAFYGCTSLTSITISNSVTSIGEYAFYGCTSLTSITIPNSVTSIGNDAFIGCASLTINCEATSQPEGWSADWNPDNRPVNWGYKA